MFSGCYETVVRICFCTSYWIFKYTDVCLVCTHGFVGADQSVPNEHFSWLKISVSSCGNELCGGVTKKDAKQRKGEARGKVICTTFSDIQGVPLPTKPGISLIILTPMKILQ
jgi:hypothetical protein